jgi:hypothetical protein
LRCLLGDRVRRADSYADTHADTNRHRRSDTITDGVCRTDADAAVRLGFQGFSPGADGPPAVGSIP